ncbi:MAG: oligosaccharide flippase family protein [Bacteroidota bacterium]
MHRDFRVFFRHLGHLLFVEKASLVLHTATLPLLAKAVGLEQLGTIHFIGAIAAYFLVCIGYGFRYTATHAIAQHQDNPFAVGQILGAVYCLKLLLILLCACVAVGLILVVPKIRQLQVFFLTYLLGVSLRMLFPIFIFQGLDKMAWMTGIRILSKIVLLLSVYTLMHKPQDAIRYPILLAVTNTAQLCIAWYLAHYGWGVRLHKPTWPLIYAQLRQGLPIFLAKLPIAFCAKLPRIFLGLSTSATQVAIYTLGVRITRLTTGVVGPLVGALFPIAHRKFTESSGESLKFVALVGVASLSLLALLGGCYWLFANAIVRFLSGQVIPDAVWILRLHAFLPCIIALSNIIGIGISVPTGAGKQYALISWVSGLLCVVLHVLWVPSMQARGAAVSVLLCEALSAIGISWQTCRRVKPRTNS